MQINSDPLVHQQSSIECALTPTPQRDWPSGSPEHAELIVGVVCRSVQYRVSAASDTARLNAVGRRDEPT